jgi:Trk K+ transport system NAD-binding subunit
VDHATRASKLPDYAPMMAAYHRTFSRELRRIIRSLPLRPGAAVRELGLPRDALIAVINRGRSSLPPRGSTQIQPGDRLFVLVPRSARADLNDVFTRWRRRV